MTHPNLKRKGNDLLYTADITLREALLGSTVQIPLLSGQNFSYYFKGITNTAQRERLPGQGMPISKHPNTRGDILVKFEINLPSNLSTEQRALLADVVN